MMVTRCHKLLPIYIAESGKGNITYIYTENREKLVNSVQNWGTDSRKCGQETGNHMQPENFSPSNSPQIKRNTA